MTKKEMIDYIEESGMVINFSRSYFNKMLRARVEEFYNDAIRFCNRIRKEDNNAYTEIQ